MTPTGQTRRADDSRIAVIETELKQIMRNQDDHQTRDDRVFDTVFETLKNNQKAVMERIGELDATMQKLWDERNQRSGAMKFSGLFAHGLTALVAIGGVFGIKVLIK